MRSSLRMILALVACVALLGSMTLNAHAAPKYVLQVSYCSNPGEATDLAAKEWAKLVDERSKGEVQLQLFPSSQLGTLFEAMEQSLMGSNVISLADPGMLADYVPDIGIMFCPYLSDDWDKVMKLYKTDWFKGLEKQLEEKGLISLSYWVYGARSLVSKKPVYKPEDLKGMKIRVPLVRTQVEAFKAMGATPTPMPISEVYAALTQGVIDGGENPLNVLYGQKWHEPTKNLSLIEYLRSTVGWMMGTKYIETLPPEVVQLLRETCEECSVYAKKFVLEEDVEVLKKMEKEGVKIHKVDQSLFRDAAQVTYTKFPEWTPGLYDTVQKLMADMK